MMNLASEVKITQAITPTNGAAATTDIKGVTLDMLGFEAVTMMVTFGAITTNAVTSIKAQQSSTTTDGDFTDLTGTSQTVADSDDEKIFYIDLIKPEKRYVRLYVDRGTQNAVVSAATYLQYGAKKVPVTHDTVVSGETWQSPIEGTA